MNALPIKYARTSDGVNIAYSAIGGGAALIEMPTSLFGLPSIFTAFPEVAAYYEAISRERMVVGYDGRGAGESDRDE